MSGPVLTMVRIQLRTGWKAILVWVVALGGTMEVDRHRDQRALRHPREDPHLRRRGAGRRLVALNGRVAGIDSLGGVIANEFGFLASFAIPFMAVSLVSRMTRKDEEQGRHGGAARRAVGRGDASGRRDPGRHRGRAPRRPHCSWASSASASRPSDAVLYALSMGALGLVFAACTALAAQLAEHTRGVYAIGLGTIVASYLLRGRGRRPVVAADLALPAGLAGADARVRRPALVAAADPVGRLRRPRRGCAGASPRDATSEAPCAARPRTPTRPRFLRTPLGIALRSHRGSLLGWTAATVIVSATFGSLAQPLIDAIDGNPAMQRQWAPRGRPDSTRSCR